MSPQPITPIPEPVTWLWMGRIPERAVTLVFGGHAHLFATWFAAAASTGKFDGPPRHVLLSSRRDPSRTIAPELHVNGADPANVELHAGGAGKPRARPDVLVVEDVDAELLTDLVAAARGGLTIVATSRTRFDAPGVASVLAMRGSRGDHTLVQTYNEFGPRAGALPWKESRTTFAADTGEIHADQLTVRI